MVQGGCCNGTDGRGSSSPDRKWTDRRGSPLAAKGTDGRGPPPPPAANGQMDVTPPRAHGAGGFEGDSSSVNFYLFPPISFQS